MQHIASVDWEAAEADRTTPRKRWWTTDEDEKLRQLVEEYGAKNWKRIAGFFEERSDVQCLHRWQKVLNPKLIKGPWVTSN
jgi:myb-related protein